MEPTRPRYGCAVVAQVMDTTRTAVAPEAAAGGPGGTGGTGDDWETMVLGRHRTAPRAATPSYTAAQAATPQYTAPQYTAPQYIAYSRTTAEPIYAELVGQWLALGRAVPAAPRRR